MNVFTSLITSAEKEYPRNIIGGGREGEVKFKPNTLNCTKTTFDVNPKFSFFLPQAFVSQSVLWHWNFVSQELE